MSCLSAYKHTPRSLLTTALSRHWQLRSLIGVDGQNHVYFPTQLADNGTCAVQRLNTKTRETETVKRLSFNPRCLVARNGWVCCGGEDGKFSAFRVGGWNPNDSADRRLDLQPDDPLPLELPDAFSSILGDTVRSEKNSVAETMQFGRDRVNCITLWFPPPPRDRWVGAYDNAVAVLAHNDSSVVTVDLRHQEMLDRLTYPDYMNRGVISPDGRLLIAISDDPFLYIHERRERKPEPGTPFRVTDRPTYCWEQCGRIQLKSQKQDDRSDNRCVDLLECILGLAITDRNQGELCGLFFQHWRVPGRRDTIRHHFDFPCPQLDPSPSKSSHNLLQLVSIKCGVRCRARHGLLTRPL